MRSFLFLIIAVLAGSALAQEQHRRVGAIVFFGSAGFDLQNIKAHLKTKEGDELPESTEAMLTTIEKIKDSIRQSTGRSPTDATVVCCDINGQSMILSVCLEPPSGNLHSIRPLKACAASSSDRSSVSANLGRLKKGQREASLSCSSINH